MTSQISYFLIFCLFNILFTNLTLAKNEYDMTIEEYISHINGPAAHKFQLENGRTVFCIRYEDQVSLRVHPEWAVNKTNLNSKLKNASQIPNSAVGIHREEGCPEGTFPKLEITYEEVNAAGSVQNFLRRDKYGLPQQSSSLNNTGGTSKSQNPDYQLFAVFLWRSEDGNIVRVDGKFSVWDPLIEHAKYSLGQMWLTSDSKQTGREPLQTIEVGWQVFPALHAGQNPNKPHFFVYWTKDNSIRTGCYNTDCHGYVSLTSGHIEPGDVLDFSEVDGDRKEIHIKVIREIVGGITAYVLYVDNIMTGYWPITLFGSLSIGATEVRMGGEVVSHGDQPTKTYMGSGEFPENEPGKAAYVRQIDIRDGYGHIVSHDPYIEIEGKASCYSIYENWLNALNSYWAVNLFYGGSGAYNPQCLR